MLHSFMSIFDAIRPIILSMNLICSFFDLSFEASGAEQIEFVCAHAASKFEQNELTHSFAHY
jgi:hypothetical protein